MVMVDRVFDPFDICFGGLGLGIDGPKKGWARLCLEWIVVLGNNNKKGSV